MTNRKKWKDSLLKSGLPLEYLIIDMLHRNNIIVDGEYTFIRPNEHGINTEFSTDISASKQIIKSKDDKEQWCMIHFLIECKFRHKNIQWIFFPWPEEPFWRGSLLKVFKELTPCRIDEKLLYDFDKNYYCCFKGVELHEGHANPNDIKRGITQLAFASVQKTEDIIENVTLLRDFMYSFLQIVVPILVTNAQIYQVYHDVALDDIEHADDIEEIADQVDALILSNSMSSQLISYSKNKVRDLKEQQHLIDSFQELKNYLKDTNIGGKLLNLDELYWILVKSSNKVLVVNSEAVERIILKIIDIVKGTEPSGYSGEIGRPFRLIPATHSD